MATESPNENAEHGRDWTVIDRDTQRWRAGVDQKTAEILAGLLVDHDRRVEIIKPDGSRELRDPEPGGDG